VYEVLIEGGVERQLKRLASQDFKRIVGAMRDLASIEKIRKDTGSGLAIIQLTAFVVRSQRRQILAPGRKKR